ncbi:MAG: hypothetical protein LBD97_01790 [Bifidobacteriaceae bacterium]|jgi:protein-tyrosine phosphatase|nr:hypothetical protein [Bifidobacteriaceae bacterium]
MTGRPFAILTVCEGNISRSPAAQFLLAAALGKCFTVESAGVAADGVAGRPVDRWTRSYLSKRGVNSSAHGARQLNGALIGNAELILTMTLDQRAWVVAEVPRALRRTFTIREFARLALAVRGQNPNSLSDMVRRAAASRAVYPVAPGGSDEIADPAGGLPADYEAAFEMIDRAVALIVPELTRYERLRAPAGARPHAGFVL